MIEVQESDQWWLCGLCEWPTGWMPENDDPGCATGLWLRTFITPSGDHICETCAFPDVDEFLTGFQPVSVTFEREMLNWLRALLQTEQLMGTLKLENPEWAQDTPSLRRSMEEKIERLDKCVRIIQEAYDK